MTESIINNLNQLLDIIKAQDEYITFLSNEISKTAVFLSVHGMQTSKETVEIGKVLRKKISELKGLGEV